MSIVNRLHEALERSSTNIGRTYARRYLLGRGDRFLADVGLSRELLERGNGAWPWRAEPSLGTETARPTRAPLAAVAGRGAVVAAVPAAETSTAAPEHSHPDREAA